VCHHDLPIATVGGLVATAMWVGGAAFFRAQRLRHVFGWLEGTYSVTAKLEDRPRESDSITITVKKNVLKVGYALAEGDAEGQIVMDERLPTSGRGLYWHDKNGNLLWGFWDTQIRRDEASVLVHTTFAKAQTKAMIAEGFIWKRIGPVVNGERSTRP
jgi:hypothetical protein